MKKILSIFISFLLIMCFTVPAFAAYNASNVIGQRDVSNNPSYTTSSANNGGSVGARGLSTEVRAIKLDPVNHRLFVADRNNNRVLVYNLDTSNNLIDTDADNVLGQASLTATAAVACNASSISNPSGLEYDSVNNRLFVTSNHSGTNSRVMVFDLSGGITDGMAATNVIGQANLTTCANSVTRNQKNLFYPFDLLYDTNTGLLYVSDLVHNRVMVYDARPGVAAGMTVCGLTTTGLVDNMDASCVLGQPDFTTSSSGNSSTKINGALGLALDSVHNRLYVSEYAGNRIKVYDTSALSVGMAASYVIGQTGFATATTGTTSSTFNWPGGLSYDSTTGYLYVSDENNHRVMIFDTSSGVSTGMSASYIFGADDFTTVNSTVTAATIGAVHGIDFDSANKRLYVCDTTNSRILIFEPTVTLADTSFTNAVQGSAYSASFAVSGEQQTVSLSLQSGSLPTGLSLSGSSITGTPTTPGNYTFSVKALDSGIHGIFETIARTFSLVVNPRGSGRPPLIYPKGVGGNPVSFSVVGTGGRNVKVQWNDILDAKGMSFSTDENFVNGSIIDFNKNYTVSVPGTTNNIVLYGRVYSSTGNYVQYGPVKVNLSKTSKKSTCKTLTKKNSKGKLVKVCR